MSSSSFPLEFRYSLFEAPALLPLSDVWQSYARAHAFRRPEPDLPVGDLMLDRYLVKHDRLVDQMWEQDGPIDVARIDDGVEYSSPYVHDIGAESPKPFSAAPGSRPDDKAVAVSEDECYGTLEDDHEVLPVVNNYEEVEFAESDSDGDYSDDDNEVAPADEDDDAASSDGFSVSSASSSSLVSSEEDLFESASEGDSAEIPPAPALYSPWIDYGLAFFADWDF